MATIQASKYRTVKVSNFQTSVTNAISELEAVEKSLSSVKDDLANPANIPSGVGEVVLIALSFATNPTTGVSSVGALKKYLNSLKTVAKDIVDLQAKWKEYDELSAEIRRYKRSDEKRMSYYHTLINEKNKKIQELTALENKIDTQVKKICEYS